MDKMNIGTAYAIIELIPGMDMTGYLGRASSSTGVHDELMIRCIVFNDGVTEFALVVCDLLGLDSRFVKETAKKIGHCTSIPSGNIVIACTHTHSGPASIFLQDCGNVADAWLERLQNDIMHCAAKAHGALKPSIIACTTAACDIGKNRVIKDGSEMEKVDHQAGIAVIKDAGTGKIDSLLINAVCHPVVLDEANLLYSKDFPHYLIEGLEGEYGPDLNVIFANGCCGDINPIERGSYDAAQRLGQILANNVIQSIEGKIEEADLKDSLITIRTFNVKIPLKHELSQESIQESLEEYKKNLDEEIAKNGETVYAKVPGAFMNWAERMQKMIMDAELPESVDAEIKVIYIGKLVIVTLPFEAFHETGEKIKEHFGAGNTMVLGYANGDYGYLPSRELYSISSYEAGMAYRYYGYPGPVCENAEDIIYHTIFK